MLLILRETFDFIFPPTEDEKIIANLETQHFTNKIHIQTTGEVISLSSFRDPEMRAAIHLIKFHGNKHALKLTAALLETWLLSKPEQQYILIPLPLSNRRYRERGFNQSEQIAQVSTHKMNHVTIRTDILTRNKHTAPQSSLSKEKRIKNVSGAFSVNVDKLAPLRGTHIILFDDVVTTGATMREAKTTLFSHIHSPITCVALAH